MSRVDGVFIVKVVGYVNYKYGQIYIDWNQVFVGVYVLFVCDGYYIDKEYCCIEYLDKKNFNVLVIRVL